MSCDSPLYIRPHAKAVLNKAIEEDTKFLADNCVMDYSLLVGLEPNSDELVLGIIGENLNIFTFINVSYFSDFCNNLNNKSKYLNIIRLALISL